MRIYSGSFASWDDVLQEFGLLPSNIATLSAHERLDAWNANDEPTAVFAVYDQYDYDGRALVAFLREDTWYVVEASHCSCYGLSECWKPEVMPHEAILRMAERASYGLFQTCREQIMAVIAAGERARAKARKRRSRKASARARRRRASPRAA